MKILIYVFGVVLLLVLISFGLLMTYGFIRHSGDNLPNGYYISRDDEGSSFLTSLDGNYIVLSTPLKDWRVEGDVVLGTFTDDVEFAFDTKLGKLMGSGIAPGQPPVKQNSWQMSEH